MKKTLKAQLMGRYIEEWNDSLNKEAIREAVQLASQALLKHADEFILEPIGA